MHNQAPGSPFPFAVVPMFHHRSILFRSGTSSSSAKASLLILRWITASAAAVVVAATAGSSSSSSSPPLSATTRTRTGHFFFGRPTASQSPPFSLYRIQEGGKVGGGAVVVGAATRTPLHLPPPFLLVSRGGVIEAPLDHAEVKDHPPSTDASCAVGGLPSPPPLPDGREDTAASSTDNSSLTTSTTTVPLWKQEFPDMLRKKRHTFQKLSLGQVQIYLLGTAHVSNDSSQEVRLLLQQVNPDCVFVELCEARIPLLTLKEDSEAMMLSYWNNETKQGDDNKESLWNRAISLQHAAQGSMTRLQALTTVMLTTVQEEYARDLGVELGGEFQAAYRFWKSRKRVQKEKGKEENDHHHRPVHFVLGDRPVHLTLKRAWESMWWWPKAKVLVGLLWSCLVKPDPDEIRAWLQQVLNEESDILTKSFEEMRRHFPTLHRVIIAERDAYLAAKLTQTCRQLPPGSVVVAIVGAGHVRGMISWLLATNATQTPEQVIEELVSTRQRKNRAAADDPELVRHWIREVTVLQEMPHESFLWAQSQ